MILSILTPAVPSRLGQLKTLCGILENQIGDRPVEHLVLLDNKRRTVGAKRDALLRAARGSYVAYVDDDDGIAEDYVSSLLDAATGQPDVITFNQEASVNGRIGWIRFGLGSRNDPFVPGSTMLRNAWHVCAWRRSLALLSHFPDNSYGEDWAFAAQLCAIPGLKSVHIDRILHYYRHDQRTTEAPPPI